MNKHDQREQQKGTNGRDQSIAKVNMLFEVKPLTRKDHTMPANKSSQWLQENLTN